MHRQSDLRSAAEAALILVIGMGFGRFAFTALYPLMVEEGVLTLQGGSLAASANYAGYLLGALLLMWTRSHRAHLLCVVDVGLPGGAGRGHRDLGHRGCAAAGGCAERGGDGGWLALVV